MSPCGCGGKKKSAPIVRRGFTASAAPKTKPDAIDRAERIQADKQARLREANGG